MSRPGQSYTPPLYAWNIGAAVADICNRAGVQLDIVDVDLLDGYVEGFYHNNRQSCSAAISSLAKIYLFDISNHGGMLHFVPRGEAPAAFITEADLLANNDGFDRRSRHDAIRVPRTFTLEYYDSEGGLTTDQQVSDRSQENRSVQDNRESTTVIMRADDAARAAICRHKIMIEESRGTIEFSVPDSFLSLTVADVVMLGTQRARITSVNIDDGFLGITATHDRASAYESTIMGMPVDQPSEPPDTVVSDTRIEIIDSHILRDSHDRLGYYVAVSGEGMSWQGAVVQLSRDGGQNWIDGAGGVVDSIIGEIIEPVAAGPVPYPDETNRIHVRLMRPDMELLPATFAETLNRQNLCIVGDELINFRDVEQQDDGTWILSYLLRGRKGSPSVSHSVGERFVMMDTSALVFVFAELFELERELTFRATSIGAEIPGDPVTITYHGRSQIERAPAYLSAVRDDSDLQVSWQGVGRLGGGSSIGMGAFFTGYRVTLGAHSIDTTSMHATIPHAAGTLRVQQINSITGAGPAAELEIEP